MVFYKCKYIKVKESFLSHFMNEKLTVEIYVNNIFTNKFLIIRTNNRHGNELDLLSTFQKHWSILKYLN